MARYRTNDFLAWRLFPYGAAYLNYLWRFIGLRGTDAFGQWTADEPLLVGAGLGWEYPPGFEALLAAHEVSEGEFRLVLCSTTEVLFGSLYGAADEAGSRRYLTELARAVEHHGVSWPDVQRFAESHWSDGWGWGEIPSSDELTRWRESA